MNIIKKGLILFFFCIQLSAFSDSIPNYWSAKRTYNYLAIYKDAEGKLITSEKIKIKPTGKTWVYAPKQTLVTISINFNRSDSTKLASNPYNGIHKHWKRKYQEGVIQDSTKVWMHPIRRNQYVLTEIAPFPEVRLPIHKNDSWNNTLWIYKAFGSFEGTVNSKYAVDSLVKRVYDTDSLPCWKINSVANHTKLGINSAIYYFNKKYGFTEMNYTFYNGETLEIKLLKLEEE